MTSGRRRIWNHALEYGVVVALGDALGLAVAWWVAGAWIGEGVESTWRWVLAVGLVLVLVVGTVLHGWGLQAPATELRRSTLALLVVLGCLGAGVWLNGDLQGGGRAVAILMAVGIVSVPLVREMVRLMWCRGLKRGRPVVVVGDGAQGKALVDACAEAWGLGMRVVGTVKDASEWTGAGKGVTALVAGSDWGAAPRDTVVAAAQRQFEQVLVVTKGGEVTSLWETCETDEPEPGSSRRLARRAGRALKRVVDVVVVVVGGVLCLPLLVAVAVAILVESGRPVFFRQGRVGTGGKWFTTYKFRTMCEGAERQLEAILERDPELREEYDTYRKLRRDPRITRVGRLLRRWSLDELPQLWNVLRGEMSLVGPRAYLPVEVERMGKAANAIPRVRPGITGIWQVHGRSRVPFGGRVRMDVYYVRRWSLWLDLYLMARTVWVVLVGSGAC